VRRVIGLCVPLLIVLAACGGGASGSAAQFNQTKISNASFERELNALKSNKKLAEVAKQSGYEVAPKGKVNPQLAAQWLAASVEQIPVDEEFTRRKLTITPAARELARTHAAQQLAGSGGANANSTDVLDAFPKWFQDLVVDRQARVEAVIDAFTADDGFASDAAWAAANAANLNEYCPSGKVVRHILVKTNDEANVVESQLAAGGDFAAIAKEKSTDPGSKDEGGFLGCVANGQFVAPFESAMNALASGQTSAPVQTEFGFHVIKVEPFNAESAPTVVRGLRQRVAGQQFSTWLDGQMKDAKITVDPKWGTPSNDSGRFQITPPASTTTSTKPAPTSAAPASSTAAPSILTPTTGR